MIKINKKRILIILVSLLVLGFVRNVNAQLIDPIEIKSVVTTTTGLHVLVQNNLNQDFSYEDGGMGKVLKLDLNASSTALRHFKCCISISSFNLRIFL